MLFIGLGNLVVKNECLERDLPGQAVNVSEGWRPKLQDQGREAVIPIMGDAPLLKAKPVSVLGLVVLVQDQG